MSLTPEHKAKMREGRERHDEEERVLKAAREVAYSAWVREDARLWRGYVALRDARSLGDDERKDAYEAWRFNARRMPRLP